MGSACQQVTVSELSQGGTWHHQAEHVTTAAIMGADAAAVPLYDSTTGQGRQDDPLASGAATFNVDEHGQAIDGEVDHGWV